MYKKFKMNNQDMNNIKHPLKVVIIGAGGFGREVLDIFDACNQETIKYNILGFIVEREFYKPNSIVNDKPVLGDLSWLIDHKDEVFVVCAVGKPQHRRRIIQQVENLGGHFCNIVHPTAILTRWVKMGEGTIITAGCILTNQIQIGCHVHINLNCTVGHNSLLEDYVTLAPGVRVSGNVSIGKGCYVGTGANIIEKKKLGEWSIVGAGSTIIKDVPANTTVTGVPGKVIKTRDEGWHLK
jgi:sugar O-acyltransferase (sialic acid O-acetyltransferase NeuD family)